MLEERILHSFPHEVLVGLGNLLKATHSRIPDLLVLCDDLVGVNLKDELAVLLSYLLRGGVRWYAEGNIRAHLGGGHGCLGSTVCG